MLDFQDAVLTRDCCNTAKGLGPGPNGRGSPMSLGGPRESIWAHAGVRRGQSMSHTGIGLKRSGRMKPRKTTPQIHKVNCYIYMTCTGSQFCPFGTPIFVETSWEGPRCWNFIEGPYLCRNFVVTLSNLRQNFLETSSELCWSFVEASPQLCWIFVTTFAHGLLL